MRHGFAAGFAKPKENKQLTARDYRRRWQDSSIAAGTNRRAQGLEPGTASWYVGTMGLPGEERVLSAARQERFEEDRQPTMESVRASLVKKYGQPTESGRDANGHMYFYWSYDLQGRLITETSPLFHQCFAPTSLNGVFKFSPDCGFAVAASLSAVQTNHDVVDELIVTSQDQAGGYEALMRTEQGLAQLDAQRRAKETEAASRNAAAPTL